MIYSILLLLYFVRRYIELILYTIRTLEYPLCTRTYINMFIFYNTYYYTEIILLCARITLYVQPDRLAIIVYDNRARVNAARVRDIIKRFKSNPSDRNRNTLFFFNNIWGKSSYS